MPRKSVYEEMTSNIRKMRGDPLWIAPVGYGSRISRMDYRSAIPAALALGALGVLGYFALTKGLDFGAQEGIINVQGTVKNLISSYK